MSTGVFVTNPHIMESYHFARWNDCNQAYGNNRTTIISESYQWRHNMRHIWGVSVINMLFLLAGFLKQQEQYDKHKKWGENYKNMKQDQVNSKKTQDILNAMLWRAE